MTTKYLGLRIDYDRDNRITGFGHTTLSERYLYKGTLSGCGSLDGTLVDERSPQEAFARAAVYAATSPVGGEGDVTDWELAQRLYDGASLQWFGWSTPVLSNGGTTRGLPISCFLQFVPDSMDGISNHWRESAALASKGGGLGAYHGALRTAGVATSKGSRSNGMIPFLKVSDSMMYAVSQGTTRRGAYASYLPIDHPEIKAFINMRRNDGGDINRKCLNLHHGVVLSDKFMELITKCSEHADYDDSWDLIDPHTKQVIETVSARELWEAILSRRAGDGKGEPYLMFGDTVLKNMHPGQYEQGLRVVQSNLCTEITLPTNEDRTAVCCLSSLNLATYNEWEDSSVVWDLVEALDNVLEHFIGHAAPSLVGVMPERMTFNEFAKHVYKDRKAYAKAAYSAYMERSIGIGVMGLHTAMQQRELPFESPLSVGMGRAMTRHIREEAENASHWLASRRGPCPDDGSKRNAHLLAIAPTATNSIICGGVSPGIEPVIANVYTHKTDSGNFTVVSPVLVRVLENKGLSTEDITQVLADVQAREGSVQHLGCLTTEEKEVFKTAYEINQQWVIEHAAVRQEFIDQGQSVNLFFDPSMFTDKVKYTQYFHHVHMLAWKKGLKTLYYCRTKAAKRASPVQAANQADFDVKLEDCVSCEG